VRGVDHLDVQNDFLARGHAGGETAAGRLASADQRLSDGPCQLSARRGVQRLLTSTGRSFLRPSDYSSSWPPHWSRAVRSEFHPGLDTAAIEAVFLKGAHTPATAASTASTRTDQLEWFAAAGVDAVDIVGIATDHCVRRTAGDARGPAWHQGVVDLTAAVAGDSAAEALAEMRAAGIELVQSSPDSRWTEPGITRRVGTVASGGAHATASAWWGCLPPDGRIEDPVGSRPHVGHCEIGRFYDTFSGRADRISSDLDIGLRPVCLRDLDLEVAMVRPYWELGAAISKMRGGNPRSRSG